MPHKRAKQPVKDREKAQRATDSVPSISIEHEPIPKAVSRVLGAEQIRREHRRKHRLDGVSHVDRDGMEYKKRRQDVSATKDEDGGTAALKIRASETVGQFNRRVETTMMPFIKSALRQSSAQARRVRREETAQQTLKRGKQGAKAHAPPPFSSKKGPDPSCPVSPDEETVNPRHTKEFQAASTSAPRRLNDIVQEPPVLRKPPRAAIKNNANPPAGLSMAQKVMMEEERERAIKHYRELKARKLREIGGVKLDE